MKAAVCYEYGAPLQIEDVQLPPPGERQVVVDVAATAICHSDIHELDGEFWPKPGDLPLVTGHESAGLAAQVGPGVTQVAPGDRVVVSMLWSCGHCHYCHQGQMHLCTTQLDGGDRLIGAGEQSIKKGMRVGGFAEQVLVHESQLVRLPDDLPLDVASLLACGVITGVGAVVNTAQVPAGRSVVIIGAGGVGLNAVQGAAISGANPIIAVDLLEEKLAAARLFGATHTINASEQKARPLVRQLTDGLGAEYIFVTVGSDQAVQGALPLMRRGGTVVLVGMPGQTTVNLPVTIMATVEGRIIGSYMGSTRLHVDIPRLVAHYQLGRLKLDELVSGRYPLRHINEAIASSRTGHALRNVIVFGAG